MLKKIKECEKNIRRGWKIRNADPDEIILEDPKYGRIEIVANCEGGHDQICQISPTGAAIVLLVDELEDKIYLHTEERPAVMKENGPQIKENDLYIPFDYLGRDSIETIRGYSEGSWKDTAKKEIKDEAGYDVVENDLEELGHINKDTTTVASYITVVLARHNSREEFKELNEEEKQKIKNRKWYKTEEVKEMIRKNQIFCALTLAALNVYFQKRS